MDHGSGRYVHIHQTKLQINCLNIQYIHLTVSYKPTVSLVKEPGGTIDSFHKNLLFRFERTPSLQTQTLWTTEMRPRTHLSRRRRSLESSLPGELGRPSRLPTEGSKMMCRDSIAMGAMGLLWGCWGGGLSRLLQRERQITEKMNGVYQPPAG